MRWLQVNYSTRNHSTRLVADTQFPNYEMFPTDRSERVSGQGTDLRVSTFFASPLLAIYVSLMITWSGQIISDFF